MGRPPSNEFFIKKSDMNILEGWGGNGWSDDDIEAAGTGDATKLDDSYIKRNILAPWGVESDDASKDSLEEIYDYLNKARNETYWTGTATANHRRTGYGRWADALRGYIDKRYDPNTGERIDPKAKSKPEQVNSTPGTFTTSNGTTITTTPVTQETTGGGETAPQAEKSVNDMTTREYLDYQAQHAAEDIDTIVRTQGVTPAEARRIYYAMHGDNRYYGYRGQTPPSMQPAQQQPQGQPQQPQGQPQQPQQPAQPQQPQQPAQPQQPQQPQGQPQQLAAARPLGSVKAASLARAFAAGRFSSDEAGDSKVADNRAALWNRFNGD